MASDCEAQMIGPIAYFSQSYSRNKTDENLSGRTGYSLSSDENLPATN